MKRRALAAPTQALEGRGIHSGEPSRLRILPAPPGAGLRFRRADLGGDGTLRPAAVEAVVAGLGDAARDLRAQVSHLAQESAPPTDPRWAERTWLPTPPRAAAPRSAAARP